MITQPVTRNALGRLAPAALFMCAAIACSDRRSELAVVYRGGAAAERGLVRVRIDSGSRSHVVTPAFPSAAHPERVRNSGVLPLEVWLLGSGGDTVARYSPPPIRLVARSAYTLGIVVGQRPRASRCSGAWVGVSIRGRAESLFVSVTAAERTPEPPRCED